MDPSPQKLIIGSFPSYNKDLAINLLFPHVTSKYVSGKLMIISLSPKDRILYFYHLQMSPSKSYKIYINYR